MTEIPIALAHDTIYECVFEVRFASGHPAMEELMPGMLFSGLNKHFNALQQLPFAQFPKAARGFDPNLAFVPTMSLFGLNR